MGIAEKDRHHLAAEIGQGANLSIVIGQGKVACEGCAGDVGREKSRFGRARRLTAGQQQR